MALPDPLGRRATRRLARGANKSNVAIPAGSMHRWRVFALVVAGAALAASACATDDAEWLGTREQVGSVEVIRNPPAPMLASAEARAEQLWIATSPDDATANPDSLWQQAAALTVGAGHVHVLDRMAARVYVIRQSDGVQTATWGRKGRGPGELARPQSIITLGDAIGVVDGGKGTIERFAQDGSSLDPIRLPGITFTALALDSARLALAAIGGTKIFRPGSEPVTLELEPPVALTDGPGLGCRRLGQISDKLVRLSCVAGHAQVLDTLGRGIREIVLPFGPLRTADSTLERFIAEVRRDMASLNRGIPTTELERVVASTREAYSHLRRFREFRHDAATGMLALWEQLPDDLTRGPATLHLLREDGAWLATIPFEREWVAFEIADGRVYALERDPDTDVPYLAAYRLVLD